MITNKEMRRLTPIFNGLTDFIFDEVFKRQEFSEFVFFKSREESDKTVYEIPLPGYTKEDLEVEVDQNVLTIKTSDSMKETAWKSKFKYQKALENSDVDNIQTKLENGLLIVNIPKLRGSKSKIKIQ